jgi:hypothetical protein
MQRGAWLSILTGDGEADDNPLTPMTTIMAGAGWLLHKLSNSQSFVAMVRRQPEFRRALSIS